MKLSILVVLLLVAGPRPAGADDRVDYLREIKPIFARHCYQCHGPDEQESDLRLDTVAGALKGGNAGPAIVAGQPDESLLIEAITGTGDATAMPPEGERLSANQVALIRSWIALGAHAPADEQPLAAKPRSSSHWAFQPIQRPAVPAVNTSSLVRNPIDAFILACLEKEGLTPSPEADRTTLIRRLSFDLLGLPPSIAELDQFVADTRPNAYELLVDRLLASPHYGERWGRHWLDLARYADSNGYTIDGSRSIWKYRDWVIDALNRDLPFDRFTIEQIAGDMLPGATEEQQIATGFHRNTLRNEEGGTDQEQFRVEAVVDRVDTTGAVFLGLSLGCARCHDHKYDPVSQREFYQMFALFNNADEPTLTVRTQQKSKELPALAAEIEDAKKRLAETESALGPKQAAWEQRVGQDLTVKLPDNVRQALAVAPSDRSAEQAALLKAEYFKIDPDRIPIAARVDELQARHRQLADRIATSLVMQERAEPRVTHVHLRGDFLRPGAKVEPAVPAVLPALVSSSDTPSRLDLARWLVDGRNPLTPRVTVNRVWQQYFGQGLVITENDFGTQGAPPSHPDLLDWLAAEFRDSGWRLKDLHRLIVTSATYRQASLARPDLQDKDPTNRLLAQQLRLRLDAEVVRDAALAVSGLLSREIGGPGVYPPQAEGIYRFTQTVKFWAESRGEDRYRRGLYTYFWRSSPYPFLITFDAPNANVTCTRRVRSNTPLQALTLANDRGFFELAQGLAFRTLADMPADDEERLRYAFRCSMARQPSLRELVRLHDYLQQQRQQFNDFPSDAEAAAPAVLPPNTSLVEGAAWTSVARVLMNLDEFITRE